MGYTTKFTGKLEFASEPPVAVIRKINSLTDEDVRDHPEWDSDGFYFIDFRVTDELDGIEHTGAEKTYEADKIVNFILRLVREEYPDFALKGEILAQGEEHDDRWRLVIGPDGWAKRVEWPRVGQRVRCPHCEEEFTLEDAGGA